MQIPKTINNKEDIVMLKVRFFMNEPNGNP